MVVLCKHKRLLARRIYSSERPQDLPRCGYFASRDKERKLCWRLVVLVVLDRCADLGGGGSRQPAGVKEEESGIGSRGKEERAELAVGETAKKTGLRKFKNNVTQWRYERQKVCGDAFILHRVSACCKRKRQSVIKESNVRFYHSYLSHRFASRRAKFFYQILLL